ncbi:MAG: 4Fe-4S binding protein [Prevotellaceae bacterium]|nr:4Fe-4S binding protein [Prevotellaceae bacterium]
MLKKTRITLATISFILLTLLFLDFTGAMRWAHWLPKLQLVPALLALNLVAIAVVLVITLLLGRIYCSVVCPLGILQDIILAVRRKLKRKRFTYSPPRNWLRYTILVLYVVAGALGLQTVVILLDPYSAYGRIAHSLLQPAYQWGNNLFATAAERYDSYAFYHVDIAAVALPALIAALATLLIVGVLAWMYGRAYCNNICPVGSLLGLLSRFSLLKIRLDSDQCISCMSCERTCKASAIDIKSHRIDYSRCVVCGDCIKSCHRSGITFAKAKGAAFGAKRLSPLLGEGLGEGQANGGHVVTNTSRRAFLTGTAVTLAAVAMAQEKKKVDGGLAVIEDKQKPERKTPITPPGSLSAKNLARHCTACQLCVSACPNGVLQPSTSLLNLMQPTVSYERGYCRPECTRCSEVCPTGAIRRITPADKTAIHVGHAVWVRKNCVVLADDVSCGNCARHCPAGAITMVPVDADDPRSRRIPAVDEAKCIGCGACENLCPARPFSAIYVEGHEVHRND